MITCSLAKPEATLDQVRKMYPKLQATDASMVATALVLSGRYAFLNYQGEIFTWPEDIDNLPKKMLPEIQLLDKDVNEVNKQNSKSGLEPDTPEFKLNLVPNYNKVEEILKDRDELLKLVSDLLEDGVEYSYAPNDVGWQWSLEKINWTTVSNGETSKRVKFHVDFSGNSVAVEHGAASKKKKAKKKS